MPQDMYTYLQVMVEHGASDLFMSAGAPATLKIDGLARPMTEQPLDGAAVQTLVYSTLTPNEIVHFEQELELNKALNLEGIGRFRLNVYRQRGMIALVARHIKADVQTIAELGLPPTL